MPDSTATKYRNFPGHTLDAALVVARTIQDHVAGKPMNRLLLADALGIRPSSSNYRNLLSSSLKYGLTSGTEKAEQVSLTDLGKAIVSGAPRKQASIREAAMKPSVFQRFYEDYNNAKVPSKEMFGKILVANYAVPEKNAAECAELILTNGQSVGLIRNISGAPHVIFPGADEDRADDNVADDGEQVLVDEGVEDEDSTLHEEETDDLAHTAGPPSPQAPAKAKAIFLGHGRNVKPREKLERILHDFKIPFAAAVSEANLGRPIPVKVRDTMMSCGSAILIFTKDQKFFMEDGEGGMKEVWRPSENVVHELGAASLLYEDRIVIFKERGIDLPSNFSSIGYIEFDEDGIEARTLDLLKELIGFGLVTVAPVA